MEWLENKSSEVRQMGLGAFTAFSLIEMLVVVGVLALLLSLIAVGLGQARSRGRAAVCGNNFRQMIVTWNLYAGDNQERLVSNVHLDLTDGWVRGSVVNGNLGATNTQFLINKQHALFAPYIETAESYRCPADESVATIHGIDYPRVRSVSMNQAMGHESYAIWLPSKELARPGQDYYRVFRLMDDLHEPARRFVFADESEVTINDPAFAVEMPQNGRRHRWIDVPSIRHQQGASLAFGDGHVETVRWADRRTAASRFRSDAVDNKDWWLLVGMTSVLGH
jgi:prepilin-type processing-associated H-X9-DG protein